MSKAQRNAHQGANRQAKLAAEQAAQRRRQRNRRLAWVGAVVAVVVLAAAGILWATRTPSSGTASASSTPEPRVTFTDLSRNHVSGAVTYAQTPPAGGDHSAEWQNCGIYSKPVPNENAVHSLEHGAIWITYQPNLTSADVDTLKSRVRNQPYALLSPYPGLPSPIVATVWGVQQRLSSASDPALKQFIADYADASKAPEPRGECTGGLGTPQP